MDKKEKYIASFEDLLVWQKSRQLRINISNFCKHLPKEETYRLKDQLLRASRSVTANIAEGYGRYHYQENIQYCRQARGSLYEVLDHIICAYDEQLISSAELNVFKDEIKSCAQLINGYINHLRNSKDNFVKEDGIDYRSTTPRITNND